MFIKFILNKPYKHIIRGVELMFTLIGWILKMIFYPLILIFKIMIVFPLKFIEWIMFFPFGKRK